MKKIKRIVNIALIFTVIGVILSQDPALALRVPHFFQCQGSEERFENISKGALEQETWGAPALSENIWLNDIYFEIEGDEDLLNVQAFTDSPFEIYERDVRTCVLDKVRAGLRVFPGQPKELEYSTATYYTRPRASLDTEDEVVSYVEDLLGFVKVAGKGKNQESFIIIKDTNEQKIRQTLQDLCQAYSKGLVVSPGREHAYRQFDLNTPAGSKIRILAAYLNIGYRHFNRDKEELQLTLPSSIFVDEEGHLFFCKTDFGDHLLLTVSSPEFYKLGYSLGEGITNVADTRFPLLGEIEEPISPKMRRMILISGRMGDRLFVPFQRAVSDYRKEELFIQDPKKARAARIVWLLWMGILDPHLYNSLSVDGVPVDFDFDILLEPFSHVNNINLDKVTSLIAYHFLQIQTEEMDPYYHIEGYDLPTIPQTIQRIIEFGQLRDVVEEVGYPVDVHVGKDITSVNDTFHYFDDKRKNNGEWLWRTTAMTLSKLTGETITDEQLKEMADFGEGAKGVSLMAQEQSASSAADLPTFSLDQLILEAELAMPRYDEENPDWARFNAIVSELKKRKNILIGVTFGPNFEREKVNINYGKHGVFEWLVDSPWDGHRKEDIFVGYLGHDIDYHVKSGVTLAVWQERITKRGSKYSEMTVIDNGTGPIDKKGKRVSIEEILTYKKSKGKDGYSGITLTLATRHIADLALIHAPGNTAMVEGGIPKEELRKRLPPKIIRKYINNKSNGMTVTGYFYAKGVNPKHILKDIIRRTERRDGLKIQQPLNLWQKFFRSRLGTYL